MNLWKEYNAWISSEISWKSQKVKKVNQRNWNKFCIKFNESFRNILLIKILR